jgi:hypothetical protein
VENFLTDNECDVIIGLAQHHGLQASTTVRKIKNRVSREQVMDLFYKNDLDGDGTLEKYEVPVKQSKLKVRQKTGLFNRYTHSPPS